MAQAAGLKRGWAARLSVEIQFIEAGKLPQNAFAQGVDGRFRDESLNLRLTRSSLPGRDEGRRRGSHEPCAVVKKTKSLCWSASASST
ncbi:MAG: hypothetical protein AAGA54_10275 [Myxococcota bacterium]